MPKQPASGRAYEHATFECGLISLPLSVYTGTVSDHGVKRNQFVTLPVLDEKGEQRTVEVEREDGTKETVPMTVDHPVGYQNVDKETNEPVSNGDIVKKIATEYGHVFVDDHEIEQLFDLAPKTIVVKSFQPQHLLHQGYYTPKSLYYVEVSKTKVGSKKVENKNAQNNFSVILAAMRRHNAMALVEFTTRGTPKPGVLLPNGTLYTVYHTEELREQRPLPQVDVPQEVAEAAWKQYLEPFWTEEPVDLEDKRTALIQAFANEKAKAGDFGRAEEPETVEAAPAEGGMDLLAALSASVEQAKAEREAM